MEWLYTRKGGTASMEEKMTENWLRWFGHVQRRLQKTSIRRVWLSL